jgi:hypothetical protein
MGEGSAIITVSFAGDDVYEEAQNKTITVNVSLKDASVSVNNATLDLKYNDTFNLVASTYPEGLPVNFTSSNSSVVTVDVDGKVVAVGTGSAVITVSVGGDGVYALNSTSVNITVKKDLNISAYSFAMSGNVTLIVVGFENATGNVTITVEGNTTNSSIMMGMVFTSVPKSDKNVTAYIYYPGDDNYASFSTTFDIIAKKDLNLTISADPIRVGENATVVITGFENATGNVSVIGGRSFYNATIINGTATAIIPGLNKTTTAIVFYMGDNNYNMAFASANITVLPAIEDVTITASPVTATYNKNKNLVVTLRDANGNAISGAKVTINLNGAKEYTTDSNGQVKVNVAKLVPKTYTAKVTFAGSDVYAKSTIDVKVTVKKAKPKIVAKKKTYKSKKKVKKFTITLKDNKNKPIKNAKVRLIVKKIKKTSKKKKSKKSKKKYKPNIVKTNKKGKATFKVKRFKKGTYQAKIIYKGNNYYTKVTKTVKIKLK